MKIKYQYVTGETEEIEITAEVGEIITASRREEESAERRHSRHALYSLDALLYEQDNFITGMSAESAFLLKERNMRLYAALETLTPIQRRRLEMYADGMSYREIGRLEGVKHDNVKKSIDLARKKFKKFF